jgi:RecA-family ATPase
MYPSRKPAEWLMRNILPRYGVALMYGGDGTGKSFLAIDMALSIVTGTRWFGYRTKCYGDVLYVVAEGRIEDRVEAWLAERGMTREAAEQFKYVNGCPDLSEEAGRAKMTQAVNACQPCLVIVDTLASAAPAGDENSKEGVAPLMSFFRSVANKHNCCVMFISHRGKDITRGVRGWSGQRANSDCVIEINRNENMHEWIVLKLREGEDGQHGKFTLGFVKIDVDSDGEPVNTRIVVPHLD